jgi:hypothetical protein
MPDLSRLFSELDARYGLPTAGFSVVSLASFLFALKEDGFHCTNRSLMVAGSLFFIACGLYVWHQRDESSVSFTGEEESLSSRFWCLPWKSVFGATFCFLMAAIFAFVAWIGCLS